MPDRNPWIVPYPSRPQAKVTLYCFPYAGAGASIFRNWHQHLGNDVEVNAIQLPGRESRLREARFVSLEAAIAPLRAAVVPQIKYPCAFFGHSLGALVAYRLCIDLQQAGQPLPAYLFVSGRRAPAFPPAEPMYGLPEGEFVAQLRALGGTPEAVLADRDLRSLFLGILRDDLTVDEAYRQPENLPPLSCPIVAFGASADPKAAPERVEAWKDYTCARFVRHGFAGGHFFLKACESSLVALVGEYLSSTAAD